MEKRRSICSDDAGHKFSLPPYAGLRPGFRGEDGYGDSITEVKRKIKSLLILQAFVVVSRLSSRLHRCDDRFEDGRVVMFLIYGKHVFDGEFSGFDDPFRDIYVIVAPFIQGKHFLDGEIPDSIPGSDIRSMPACCI
ncbi:MAG: hypothetical protein HGA31_05245 [Candidatus Moranbacteria bacterium]|nr:hypothetical protein [Candidatus Moranbacteria bacterium]